jgi:cation transport ATPase
MEFWERQLKLARYMLLGTVIITVVNLAFLLGNVDMFISYCAAVPYYLVMLGKLFDNGYMPGDTNGEFTATGLVMGGVILGLFLVVWWFARDSRKWLQISLWLIVADLAALVVMGFILFSSPLQCFWEAVFHLAVIYEIAQGLRAQKKMEAAIVKQQEEAALQAEAAPEEEPEEAPVP